MFISSNEYATLNNLTSTKLTMIISESSYYIKNRQLPIAKLGEIIFHNLLFTLVCVEIFRLLVLLVKLIIVPQMDFITKHIQKKREILSRKMKSINHDIIVNDHSTSDNHSTTDNYSETTNDCNVIQISL